MNHLYLHGFASGPLSRKAIAVSEALRSRGHRVDVPELNLPSFEHLTITAMLAEAERRLIPGAIVWGSSLGGYLACQLAARHPERVQRLVLFAPAIEFPTAYPERAADARSNWARGGTVPVFHHARGQTYPLAGDLAADCQNWSARPAVACPTLVLAARQDEIIPLASIESWAAAQPQAELAVFDDAHDLNRVIPALLERALPFVGA